MKYIASVSFGKDSLAMLLLLIEKGYPLDAVVFYDTGMEFEAIYRTRDKVRELLKEKGIDFIQLSPAEPFWISMMIREVVPKKKPECHYGYSWCGGNCRWGTTNKLQEIRKYKKFLGDDVTDYVGIAFDETARFSKAAQEGKVLPLVDWQMTEKDCLSYCYSRGFFWEQDGIRLYDILDRVSCWCCRNKNLKELKAIYKYLPRYWKWLKGLEVRLGEPIKKGRASMFELEERFKRELMEEQRERH